MLWSYLTSIQTSGRELMKSWMLASRAAAIISDISTYLRNIHKGIYFIHLR